MVKDYLDAETVVREDKINDSEEVVGDSVLDEYWDVLIILDACRYDYFKENYKDFIRGGKLRKKISVATRTGEWLKKTFTEKYDDIIYVSGYPGVNSKGLGKENGFNSKRFFKVVDVWDYGFDEALQIIHPVEINKAFFKYKILYPDKRFIIHYMQPHSPYVGVEQKYRPKNRKPTKGKEKKPSNMSKRLRRLIYHNLMKTTRLPNSWIWRISGILGIESPLASLYLDKGWKGFREAYKDNLRFVLPHVKKVCENTKGKIVISADHGERLGEKGMFGHGGSRDKVVIEIPWFEVINK